MLTWGEYNIKKACKMKINCDQLPSAYNRLFFIYMMDIDIYGNAVIKKELYEGSQKRFIYYVPNMQT